jgi:hypothetical protein
VLQARVPFALCLWSLATSCGGEVSSNQRDAGSVADATFDAGVDAQPHAAWVEFCTALASCEAVNPLGMGDNPSPMTTCVAWQFDEGAGYGFEGPGSNIGCVLTSGSSCEQVHACFNNETVGSHCDIEGGSGCEGKYFAYCTDAGRWLEDCSSFGASCDPVVGECSTGACDPSKATFCQGASLMQCLPYRGSDGGVLGGYADPLQACAMSGGSVCGQASQSDAGLACIGPGAACAHDRCDGSTLVLCQGGHEARYDCPSLGLGCVSDKDPDTDDSDTSFCGLGTECGFDYADSCTGTTLTYCNAGKIATLDCAAAGYAECVKDAFGSHCAP